MAGVAGKVAFITGGGSGIGRATALELSSGGAKVGVCDLDMGAAEQTAALVAQASGEALAVHADVAQLGEVEAAARRVRERFGGIDILHSNAGIVNTVSFLDMTEERWDRMFAVHVGGLYNCVRAVLPGMIERGWGRIVSTSSYGALAGGGKVTHYCAAKAGIIGFTVAMACELLGTGITVNTVAPGVIDTPMFRGAPDRWREAIVRATPLGRPGKAEDIARAVAFFAAEEADFITGQVLSPNGGAYMVWT